MKHKISKFENASVMNSSLFRKTSNVGMNEGLDGVK